VTTFVVQAVLFDLDGTLVDSVASVNRSWVRICADMGWDPARVIGRFHGMTGAQAIRAVDPDLPEDEVLRLNALLIAGETADTNDVVPVPGADRALEVLPPDRWTIVTSCPLGLAMARLDAAGLPAHPAMVTSEDVVLGKPDPEPFALGASRLGFAPGDCLAIEDAPAGIRSAVAAGCRTLGVLTSHAELPGPTVADLSAVAFESVGDGIRVTF
jgi:sugar-phosphatase